MADIERIYFNAAELIQTRIELLERAQQAQNEHLNNAHADNRGDPPKIAQQLPAAADIRLEPMKLESFSGNYQKWSEWRAMYDSLIHANDRISFTQKFHYLKRGLTGSAERVLSGWQVTGENYDQAYNTLVNIFDNKYRIIMAHLDKLMQLERSTFESVENIRKLIDTTNRIMRQLSVMNCPVEHWDHMMVYVLIARMAPRTLEAWETSRDLREMPPLDEVLNFLERRSRGIINLSQSQPSTPNNNGPNERSNGAKYTGSKPKQGANNTYKSDSNGDGAISCHNCGNPHPMYRCQKFQALTLNQRRDRARDLHLCFNCLKPTHSANSRSCQFGDCKKCPGKRHNSLLCPRAVVINTVQVTSQPSTANTRQRAITDAPTLVPCGQGAQFSQNEIF